MKNKVKSYSYDEINEDLLKEFSEGSKSLEDLLNYSYNNHVETRACCIGHEDEGPLSTPYVLFVVSMEQLQLMEKTINMVLSQGNFSRHISIEINKEGDNFIVTYRFDYVDEELREAFFNLIRNSIASVIENELDSTCKYDGLFDVLSAFADNMSLGITVDGITLYETTTVYTRLDGEDLKEAPDNDDYFPIPYRQTVNKINTDEIATFIANEKNKQVIHR